MSADVDTGLGARIARLRRGDVLKNGSRRAYLTKTPRSDSPWPLRLRTLNGGEELKLYGHDLLDWRLVDTDEPVVSFTTGPMRSGLRAAAITYYSWSSFAFATHRTNHEPQLLHFSSTDLSNPWVIAGDLRLDPYRMTFYTHEKSGLPLIEHALGVPALPADPLGVLLKHRVDKTYALYAGLNAAHDGARITPIKYREIVDGQAPKDPESLEVTALRDLTNWQVMGPKRLLTLDRVVQHHRSPGMGARLSLGTGALLSRLRAMGYNPLTLAPGLVGVAGGIWGSSPDAGVLLGLGAFSTVAFGPSIKHLGSSIKEVLPRRGKASSIESAWAASAIEPALHQTLTQRLHEQIDLSKAPKEFAAQLRRMREVGEHLLLATALLDEVETAEITGLLYDHLPQSLALHAQSIAHLSEQERQPAMVHLGGQLDLIEARLEQLNELLKARVLAEQDKHSRFLDAKLRRSDLD